MSLSLHEISLCISDHKRQCENRLYNGRPGIDQTDRLRESLRIAERADAELDKLRKYVPELQRLISQQERGYDMSPPSCCSCHISPPCEWCIQQSQEEGEDD